MNFAKIALAACALFSIAGFALAQDRMPPIPMDKLTDAQKQAAKELIEGPRGELVGPFAVLLRSPEFMSRLQKTGAYLRFENSIGQKLTEFVILVTSRQWTQNFEWNTHQPLAVKAGVKPEVTAAIAEGRRPDGMMEDEALIYDFLMELHQDQSVSDATYARVVKKFGEKGVIDLIGLHGYYTMLGMMMNVTRTPLPAGKTPALATFPH